MASLETLQMDIAETAMREGCSKLDALILMISNGELRLSEEDFERSPLSNLHPPEVRERAYEAFKNKMSGRSRVRKVERSESDRQFVLFHDDLGNGDVELVDVPSDS